MAKPKTTPPKSAPLPTAQPGPGPQILDALNRIWDGAPPPTSVPGPHFELSGPAHERAPTPPHSAYLAIARTPGGFVLLDPDNADGDVVRLTPLDAVAVAATPRDLIAQVTAWATAQPPAEFPA